MATTYQSYKTHPFPSQNCKPGSFWLFYELDFKHQPAAQNDTFNIMKLKDQWIIRESFYRIKTGSALGADWDIGIAGGDEIADVDTTTTAADWVAGSYTSAAPYLNGQDRYITVQVTDAAETAGCLQVMIECIAFVDNAEPVDMNIDD